MFSVQLLQGTFIGIAAADRKTVRSTETDERSRTD